VDRCPTERVRQGWRTPGTKEYSRAPGGVVLVTFAETKFAQDDLHTNPLDAVIPAKAGMTERLFSG